MQNKILSVLAIVLLSLTSFMVEMQSAVAEPVDGLTILEVQGAEDGQPYLLGVTCENKFESIDNGVSSYGEDKKAELEAKGCQIRGTSRYMGAGRNVYLEMAYCPVQKCSVTSLETE